MQWILKGIESWRARKDRTRYLCNSIGRIIENFMEKNKVLEMDLTWTHANTQAISTGELLKGRARKY